MANAHSSKAGWLSSLESIQSGPAVVTRADNVDLPLLMVLISDGAVKGQHVQGRLAVRVGAKVKLVKVRRRVSLLGQAAEGRGGKDEAARLARALEEWEEGFCVEASVDDVGVEDGSPRRNGQAMAWDGTVVDENIKTIVCVLGGPGCSGNALIRGDVQNKGGDTEALGLEGGGGLKTDALVGAGDENDGGFGGDGVERHGCVLIEVVLC